MLEKDKEESLASSAARTAYVLYGGQVFAIIISVATFVVLTRQLGPSSYGLYVFAISFAAILGGFQNFGVGSYLSKDLARFSHNRDVRGISRTMSSGYALLFPIALVLTLISVGISSYVANFLFGSVGIGVLSLVLASMAIFFMMVQNAAIMGLIGLSRPKAAALITIVIDLSQLAFIVLLLHLGAGVNGALLGMLIGYIIGAATAFSYSINAAAKFTGFRLYLPSKKEFMGAFNFSAPIGVINMLNLVTQNLSVLVLGLFVSASILGNYGAALKGLSFTTVIFTTSSSLLIPIFSKVGAKSKNTEKRNSAYDKIIMYSLILAMPLILYIGVMANPGLHILLSGSYSYAPLYLTLICFGIAISMISLSLGSLIISRGITKKYMYYNIISTLIKLLSMAVLIPYFNVIGSIFAVFIIGGIASNLLFIRLSKTELNARLGYWRMHLILLANFILAIPMYAALLFPSYLLELVAGFAIMLAAYPMVLGLMRLVEKSDLERVTSSTAKIRYVGSVARWFCAYTLFFVERSGVKNA